MNDAPELHEAFLKFLRWFEVVFDEDWEWSLSNMGEHFISRDGTFIRPNVEDEEDDWGNRYELLQSYRKLKAILAKQATESPGGAA